MAAYFSVIINSRQVEERTHTVDVFDRLHWSRVVSKDRPRFGLTSDSDLQNFNSYHLPYITDGPFNQSFKSVFICFF